MIQSAVSPSLMCADIFDLRRTLDVFERNGIEYLHIDVMDGRFVPNFCLGTDYCRRVRAGTGIPLDIHLMIEAPERHLEGFPIAPGDLVSVHIESGERIGDALAMIREDKISFVCCSACRGGAAPVG